MDFTMEFSATSPRADAILGGTFLQPLSDRVVETIPEAQAMEEATTPDGFDQMAFSSPQDENNSHDALARGPLHLHNKSVPELLQQLVESFQYATTPNLIPAKLTMEEYRGKLKI